MKSGAMLYQLSLQVNVTSNIYNAKLPTNPTLEQN